MKYNFDEPIQRVHTNSYKWDQLDKRFGSKDVLAMWVADMDFKSPPAVIDALKKRAELGIYGYTIRPQSYYDAITNWIKRRHQWDVSQEWLTTSPGIVTALSVLVEALTEPEDQILIQTPVYAPFFQVISKNRRTIVQNPLIFENNYYRMDFDLLEQQTSDPSVKMMILCSPHNPVGRVWTKEELKRLGEICLRNNVMIVSDEIHCDLVYKGYRHIPLASISEDLAMNSITCMAPTKTFNLAGLQTSTIIIPNSDWRRKYNERLTTLSLHWENYFSVAALEAAYNEGEEWLEELLDYLQGNLNVLMDFVQHHLKPIRAIQPEGTYLVWLDCRELGMNASQLRDFMIKEAKLGLNDGYIFGQDGEGFTRINIACQRATLIEGLNRLRSALRRL